MTKNAECTGPESDTMTMVDCKQLRYDQKHYSMG